MDLEQTILEIIQGKRKAPVLNPVLRAFSVLYRLAVAVRNGAYDRGLLRSTRLDVPVVSIGNIVTGGTGKTPLIHLLAKRLQEECRLAILTRGYLSGIEKSGESVMISEGKGPLFPSSTCGDEPFFLARKTQASIWVGPDRIVSGKRAIEQGAECLLLDDGMQHRRLKRDFEIVVVDANAPFSNGRFLPAGLLRDSPRRLKEASLIVATSLKDLDHFERVKKELSHFSTAPVIGVQTEVIDKENFKSRRAGLFCGIGHPGRFLQTVRDLNQEIVDTLFLKDHRPLEAGQLAEFAENCRRKGAEVLLCTEKDYVKLDRTPVCLEVLPVAIELKVFAGIEHWEHLIENILDRLTHE